MSVFNFKKKITNFYPLIIIFTFIVLTYQEFLTNNYTPGGDGKRIFYFISKIQNLDEKFPLWNPWTFHGFPFIYEIEEFYLESIFLDHNSEYFNLCLNLFFYFIFFLLIYFNHYFNYKVIFNSNLIALIGSLYVIISYNYQLQFFHGRLINLKWILTSGIAGWFYYKYTVTEKINLKIIFYIFSSILISFSILYFYHYFFFGCFNFILLFFYLNLKDQVFDNKLKNLIIEIYIIIKKLLVLIILGLFFIFPLFYIRIEGLMIMSDMIGGIAKYDFSTANILNFKLFHLEIIKSLWPFFFLAPVFHEKKYKFLIQICLPLILMTFALPLLLDEFNFFFELWKNVPLISSIRWGEVFLLIRSFSSIIFMSIFLSFFLNKTKNLEYLNLKKKIYLIILSLSLLICIYISKHIYEKFIYFSILLIIISIFLRNSFIFFKKDYMGYNQLIPIYILILSLVIVSLNIKQSPTGKFYKAFNNKLNKNFIYREDFYSWYKFKHSSNHLNNPYDYSYFSMYFDRNYKKFLKEIYFDTTSYQRVHWWYHFNKNKVQKNKNLADLIGINSKNYEFKFFDEWIVNTEDDFKMLNQVNSLHEIMVNKEPKFINGSNYDKILENKVKIINKSAHKFDLKVSSKQDQLLFVPESFNKNWNLEINGISMDLLQAFIVFRGIPLGPGEHIIKMRFKYKPLYYTFLVSVFFLIIFYKFRKNFLSSNIS